MTAPNNPRAPLSGYVGSCRPWLRPRPVLPDVDQGHLAAPEARHRLEVRVPISMVLLLTFVCLGLAVIGIDIYRFEIACWTLLLVFAIRDAISDEPLRLSYPPRHPKLRFFHPPIVIPSDIENTLSEGYSEGRNVASWSTRSRVSWSRPAC